MPGPLSEKQVRILQDDFSGGIGSRISPVGARGAIRALKDAMNFWFRPKRAISVRPGSRDISTVSLPEAPTSLGKHYASGGNKLYAGTDDGVGGGKVFRLTTTGRTQQTLAATPAFTATDEKWRFEMANGLLIATQRANTGQPQFYAIGNPADTWHSLVLPKPTVAITFAADSAGGFLADTKVYYWRHRYRYTNGASLTGPVSAGNTMNTANLTANLIIPLPASPRSDFLGWTLERTDQNGTAAGPFYWVRDSTSAAEATAADGLADSSLGYRADETLHGEPVAMDGVIFHKGRLFGWRGSTVYLSNLLEDEEGTGIANWIGDANYDLDKDDGDSIATCIRQGDRLMFGKRNSIHVIEGDDVDSFRVRRIADGVGFCGPRAACSVGPTVFFCSGNGRLFVARADSVQPWMAEELGDQLLEMNPAFDDDVLAVNWRGQQVLFWHRRRTSDAQRDYIGYDLEFGTPLRGSEPPAIDALVQKDGSDFGSATLILADPVLREPAATTSPSTNPSFYSWRDNRGASTQVYVQSLDNLGAPRWAANGVQVGNSTGASQALYSAVCGDGAGGIIVAYLDNRSGSRIDLYAQRYNAAGVAQWAANGVVVCNVASSAVHGGISICADGSGGAIIAWVDGRSVSGYERIYAQRIDSAGAVAWTANGVLIYNRLTSGGGQIAETGAGAVRVVKGSGATSFVYWECYGTNHFMYQLLDASGVPQLMANGVIITSTQNLTLTGNIQLISDGAGGALLAYASGSSGTGDIFVRKLSSAGATSWTTNATAGRAGSSGPLLAPDGAAGVIVAWRDLPGGGHIRAQRITTAGALAWVAGGVPLSIGTSETIAPQAAVSDGSGGAVFGWSEVSVNMDAYVNKVDSAGQVQWGPNGVAIYTANTNTNLYPVICTDGAGGAIAAFFHSNTDIRSQRVNATGTTQWTTSGLPVVTASGAQDLYKAIFTDTPEAEYPPSATAGYHVWSNFEGVKDLRSMDGSLGQAIRATITTHRYDAGLPEHIKDAETIELIVNKGAGEFSVTVEGDPGIAATLSLETEVVGFRCDDGTLLDTASCVCAVTGESTIDSGLPPGTEGRGLRVTVAGDFTDEVEIGGLALRALALPWESN